MPRTAAIGAITIALLAVATRSAMAADKAELSKDSQAALAALYAKGSRWVAPTVVVMDEGKAKSTTTTTMNDDIYAFIFSQKGLMGGLGLQGNNIRKIDPD
jgi:hypothetical protein